MPWPRTGYGNPGGEPEESVLAESAMSSFLGSLRAAGIAGPQGVSILGSTTRVSSEAAPSAASHAAVSASFVSQGGSLHDSGHDAAVASPARSLWFDESVNVGASFSHAEPSLCAPAEPLHRVSFADVPSLGDDDRASIVSEKTLPSGGLRSVLHLLFQLCPSAAVEVPPPLQRTCDFEGLFGSAPRPVVREVPTNLFHRIAELFPRCVCGSRWP